jgi:glucose 1-dehydrogenase
MGMPLPSPSESASSRETLTAEIGAWGGGAFYRPSMPRLADRTIVVTGGASGLGRALALAFAGEGARVVIGDVRRDPLHVGGTPTDEAIAAAGGSARFVECDVSRAADIDRLVASALELGDGRLDVMVNNAMVAGPHSKGLLETTEDDWDVIFAVGLRGTFLGSRRAVAQMLTQEPRGDVRGRVINMSSEHGMVGAPGHVAYCAMKGGVVNLTRQIAVDFATQGIVCNAIAPGKIVTPREGGVDPELPFSHARTPWSHLGTPEDVAALGVFLASDDCRFTTGANVLIDGGYMAY